MDALQEIGLTERESRVYSSLLGLGSTTTGPLIKKSGVPNSKIYEVLEKLQMKGLVSWIVKGKTKHFQASPPNALMTLIKEKERILKEALPGLEIRQKLSASKKSVELYEGIPAMRAMLLGLIRDARRGEDWLGFSTGESSKDRRIEDFYEWWGAAKIKAGLQDHLLISAQNMAAFEKSMSREAKAALKGHLRYGKLSFPGDTAVFQDFVLMFDWEDTPSAMLIRNKNLARQYRDFFLGVWRRS